MQLTDPARAPCAPPCPGGGTAPASARRASSTRSASYSVSSTPFAAAKPPSTIPPSAQPLSGSGEVDARDLEQRDPLVAGVHVPLGRPRRARRAASSRSADWLACHRVDAASAAPSGTSAGVYASREPGADEHVLAHPAQALLDRQPPEHLAPQRQRERHLLEAVDADDLLDHVDLARDVARAPGRHGDDARALLDLEAEPLEDPALLDERDLEPGDARRCAPAAAASPAAPAGRPGRRSRPRSAPSSARRAARSRRSRPARRGTGRRPSPSGSSPRCAARAAPSCA